jgi:hypothetical protein
VECVMLDVVVVVLMIMMMMMNKYGFNISA